MSLAFNPPHELAHGTDTGVKPEQFAAKPRHYGVIACAPGQNGNPVGHDGVHSTLSAPHFVSVLTKYECRAAKRLHNPATGNTRAWR